MKTQKQNPFLRRQFYFLLLFLILSYPLFSAVRTYLDYENGTVKDTVTGLVWQKCSYGQNNDAGCTGSAGTKIWKDALSYCEGLTLGGRSDWRLPALKELLTLVNPLKSNPAIDTALFPNTVSSYYWSSSPYVSNPTSAWIVNFNNGAVYYGNMTGTFQIRCVAGGN
ncbi:MAG: hypothetical protein A2Y41_01915 [Spirochaetes bacterium GWB1_36_13]|nr:MAG: hypothetical protein A2Y41_01915 [Spirochaetes bacterium GWB1_36_13]